MARQVYYDPFGMRLSGYQAGVNDEQALQGATRAARGIDWDFNNMKPLELQGAQRAEAYNQFADPFLRNSTRRIDYAQELAAAMGFGGRTGNFQPAQNVDFGYFQPNMSLIGDDGTSSHFYRDPTGVMQAYRPSFDAYSNFYQMTDPAMSAYGIRSAEMEAQRNQFEAQQAANQAWQYINYLNAMKQQGGALPSQSFGLVDGYF